MKKLCAITTIDITLSSFVVNAMRKLQEEGYDITFISSMSNNFYNKFRHEFHCINLQMSRGTNPLEMLKSIWMLYKIFRRERFDYIQYATPNASLYASVAAFMVGCPIRVYCQWGIRYVGFEGMKRSFFKMLEILTCKLSTHIRPASQKNLVFAVSEGHYPEKKAAIIGAGGTIGVDFKVFDKSKKEAYKAAVIEKYPILQNRFVFGFVGRMDRDKGTNELFSSFLKLHQKYPNVGLLFIGPEDKITGIDISLYQAVKDSGAAVFTGFTSEVPQYISAIDVLVHPSYREGFSMVIQQAMAMEIAVVTTNIPGPSEVIEENVSGLLAEAKDSESLAQAMEKFLQDNVLRSSMAHEGYNRARKLFERGHMLELTCIDRKRILQDL
ncbi:MAG TPA: glycosyltransferase family 4 protein [Candidatus Bacteroides merdigallinarum]|uniref:Glycosyltransferase family 4 protein n=1 Tax=Candidatus Bacteroides merdigallinarum TaxID=2838473 RepID=A0A9D2E6M1_9BACE|nr:glycosyltransferase family 4 protein [Candidatus Bacteroides merdigallinarum]